MADQSGLIGSLWEHTVASEFKDEPLQGDVRCDVVVIGSGFTGLRAALDLAQAGSNVIVLDAEHVGWGASGRNGGQVNPLLPVARPEQLRAAVGPKYFERIAQVSLGSADELFDLVRKHQITCDARQNGWLRVDHCSAARNRAREASRAWGEFGHSFELVDGADLKKLTGSPIYESAVLAPKGGAVQPLSLVRGLAHAAEANGARIFCNAPVKAMARLEKRWVLNAGAHKVDCETVIIATNGYTGRLTPELRRSMMPLVPIQVATDPLPEAVIGEILPQGQTIADTRRVIMYARREPDDRIVYGGIGYRSPFGNISGFNWLERDAERVFPALKGTQWNYRWGGQIALTEDRVPHLHEPEPGVIAGFGYNGRGVAMSLVMGRILADRALGAAADSLPLPVSPVKPYGFRTIQQFGSGIAIQGMRLMDSIESRFAA